MPRQHSFIFRIAMALLCLVIITTCFTAGLYARYVVRQDDKSAARVAAFVIETDLDRVSLGTQGNPTLVLGGEEEILSARLPFYVTSESEVAVEYSVRADFGAALPSYLTLTLSDGTRSESLAADGVKQDFDFSRFGSLAAGADALQRADLTLTFSCSDGSAITDEISIPTAVLTVGVYQLD